VWCRLFCLAGAPARARPRLPRSCNSKNKAREGVVAASMTRARVRTPYAAQGCTVPLMHIKHKNPRFTLLFSHGNAEDIGVNKLFCEWLSAQLAVDIVTYDYTGYGLSSGDEPCEKHLYADR
jgi:pimeloyl-ACP methyl ester carboxylesterase